jgi:uncharacterized protein YpuA (DUF1002 family)
VGSKLYLSHDAYKLNMLSYKGKTNKLQTTLRHLIGQHALVLVILSFSSITKSNKGSGISVYFLNTDIERI